MRVATLILAALLTAAPTWAQEDDAARTDADVITERVFDYFHGQGAADRERLFRAFAAEQAFMIAVLPDDEGVDAVRRWDDMATVLEAWSSNETPPGEARSGEILQINITDGRIATVHFRSADRFYDVLTLAKVGDDWKIIAKAFVLQ